MIFDVAIVYYSYTYLRYWRLCLLESVRCWSSNLAVL